MKRSISLLILIAALFILPKFTFSQESDEYMIELKNGVSMKCFLISISDNTIFAISEEGKKINLDMSEVKSLNRIFISRGKDNSEIYEGRRNDHGNNNERDNERYHERENEHQNNYEYGSSDYSGDEHMRRHKGHLSFTLKGGSLIQIEGRGENPLFSATGIVDYELRHFSLGVGFSVDGLSASREGDGQLFTPVFADLKYNFRKMLGVTPFIFTDAGYSISSRSARGLMLSGGIGIKKKISKVMSLVVDAGVKYQRYRAEDVVFAVDGDPGFPVEPGFDNRFRRSRSINSLNLNVGLQF